MSAILFAGVLAWGGCRPVETVPASSSFSVRQSPAEACEQFRPALTPLLAAGTQIVRVDEPDGALLRFSLKNESDGSIRLVEVRIKAAANHLSDVAVVSERFSFLRSARRDAVDARIEREVAGAISNLSLAPTAPR